jgi:hypothetical protein
MAVRSAVAARGYLALACAAGAALVLLGPTHSAAHGADSDLRSLHPAGDTPAGVLTQALESLPAGAHDVEVEGAYGSVVHGGWGWVVALSWTGRNGPRVGSLELPDSAGLVLSKPGRADPEALPLATAEDLLRAGPTTSGIGLLDLYTDRGHLDLVSCQAPQPGPGGCLRYPTTGSGPPTPSRATLTQQAAAGPLAVETPSAPIR